MARAGPPARHRVMVTGVGAVSAVGWGVEALWSALRAGRTGIGPFSSFEHARQRTHLAAEVPEGPPPGWRRPVGWKKLAFSDRFAIFAAMEAVARAGLGAPLDERPAGVFFGSSSGGLRESESFLEPARGDRAPLSFVASRLPHASGDAVARHLGVTGPVRTISSACASSGLALEDALRSIRDGEVELAVVGGVEALSRTTYTGFNSWRAVDESPCRPFREGRAGISLGEGAAALVLEPLDRVRARGAAPLAELLGAGASCDAHHITAPHPEGRGAADALRRAIRDAGLTPEDVTFLNAHGTGTPLNDAAEAAAFLTVFGPRGGLLPVSATKSIVGHLLGASGAMEAVATVLCLCAGAAHPAAGDGRVDPALAVDLVVGEPRPLPAGGAAASLNLSFGGANVAAVLAPWPER